MGRPKSDNPKLRRQAGALRPNGTRAPDRAFVEIDGKRHYVGEWGTPESKSAYHRLLAEWHTGVRDVPKPSASKAESGNDLTVVELVEVFLNHLEDRHNRGDLERPEAFAPALAVLTDLYGTMPVQEFRAKHLIAVQDAFIKRKWSAKTVNDRLAQIRQLFRWGVPREYVTEAQAYSLTTVKALPAPGADVPPAPMALVNAVKPLVSRQVRAMIDLQLLTGARPGELCIMRPMDIQMGKDPWEYRPSKHKTQRFNKNRIIYLGPQAQAIVRQFLANRRTDAFLFSPADAEAERRAVQRANRKSHPGANKSRDKARRKNPRQAFRDHYTTTTYRRAVVRACDLAFPVPKSITKPEPRRQWREDHRWHPHQLRHNFATRIANEYGHEVAATLLGHSDIKTTQVYVERDHDRARELTRKTG